MRSMQTIAEGRGGWSRDYIERAAQSHKSPTRPARSTSEPSGRVSFSAKLVKATRQRCSSRARPASATRSSVGLRHAAIDLLRYCSGVGMPPEGAMVANRLWPTHRGDDPLAGLGAVHAAAGGKECLDHIGMAGRADPSPRRENSANFELEACDDTGSSRCSCRSWADRLAAAAGWRRGRLPVGGATGAGRSRGQPAGRAGGETPRPGRRGFGTGVPVAKAERQTCDGWAG